MTDLPPDVRAALTVVAGLVERDRGTWCLAGMRIPIDDAVRRLGAGLYERWYAAPSGSASAKQVPHGRHLTGPLRAAHAAAGGWDDGWVVVAADVLGAVTAVRGDVTRRLRPGEYVSSLRPGAPAAPGEPVLARTTSDHVDTDRGLWWGATATAPSAPLTRFYLDARPDTAPRVVALLSAAVAQADVHYQFKCPVLPLAVTRRDAIVAYVARSDADAVRERLQARGDDLLDLLDPDVPPLTCRIAPGLSWADDVDPERSYGENRTHLLAAAIDAVGPQWPQLDIDERVTALVDGLRTAGVDPARPWSADP